MTQSSPPPREPAAPVTDIDAYLRQYRDKFTRDAMAARLIEAGHDPAAVDAAIARLEAERTEAVEGAVRAADAEIAGARRVTRTIVLVVYALLALCVVVSLGMEPADLAAASNLVFVVLLVALGALIFWIIGRAGSTSSMVAWSVVAVVVGMPLAFLGACLASVTVG
jgi:lipopolysaccharide export LptBFGC system permease protein LptF